MSTACNHDHVARCCAWSHCAMLLEQSWIFNRWSSIVDELHLWCLFALRRCCGGCRRGSVVAEVARNHAKVRRVPGPTNGITRFFTMAVEHRQRLTCHLSHRHCHPSRWPSSTRDPGCLRGSSEAPPWPSSYSRVFHSQNSNSPQDVHEPADVANGICQHIPLSSAV